jgi:hypothetical protein
MDLTHKKWEEERRHRETLDKPTRAGLDKARDLAFKKRAEEVWRRSQTGPTVSKGMAREEYMEQKSTPSTDEPSSSAESGPTVSKGMTHAEYMRKLYDHPRFKVRTGTGAGYIIGGQPPSTVTGGSDSQNPSKTGQILSLRERRMSESDKLSDLDSDYAMEKALDRLHKKWDEDRKRSLIQQRRWKAYED